MAVPTIAATGARDTEFANALEVPYPSGISSGHLLILQTCNRDTAAMDTPTDWDLEADSGATNPRTQIFTKIAVGSESGSLTVSTSGGDASRIGYMHRSADADSVEAAATNTGSDKDPAHPNITTTDADRLVLSAGGINDDQAASSFTGETGGDLTLHTDELSTVGDDISLSLQTAGMASSGTISGGTWSYSGPVEDWSHACIAIYLDAGGTTFAGDGTCALVVDMAADGDRQVGAAAGTCAFVVGLSADALGFKSGVATAALTVGMAGDAIRLAKGDATAALAINAVADAVRIAKGDATAALDVDLAGAPSALLQAKGTGDAQIFQLAVNGDSTGITATNANLNDNQPDSDGGNNAVSFIDDNPGTNGQVHVHETNIFFAGIMRCHFICKTVQSDAPNMWLRIRHLNMQNADGCHINITDDATPDGSRVGNVGDDWLNPTVTSLGDGYFRFTSDFDMTGSTDVDGLIRLFMGDADNEITVNRNGNNEVILYDWRWEFGTGLVDVNVAADAVQFTPASATASFDIDVAADATIVSGGTTFQGTGTSDFVVDAAADAIRLAKADATAALVVDVAADARRFAKGDASASLQVDMSGSVGATFAALATASLQIDIAGDAENIKAGAAQASIAVDMAGDAVLAEKQGSATAAFSVDVAADARRFAQGAATAAAEVDLQGAPSGLFAAKATAAFDIDLSGASIEFKLGSGTAAFEVDLAAAAGVVYRADGTAAFDVDLSADTSEFKVGSGTFSFDIDLSGAPSATFAAAATAALEVDTAGDAIKFKSGDATASIQVDMAADATITGAAVGSGTASFDVDASADAVRLAVGAGVAAFDVDMVGAPSAILQGKATASLQVDMSADAGKIVQASAAASIDVDISAAATEFKSGAGQFNITALLAGDAIIVKRGAGTAAFDVDVSGDATIGGTFQATGTIAFDIDIAANATGGEAQFEQEAVQMGNALWHDPVAITAKFTPRREEDC